MQFVAGKEICQSLILKFLCKCFKCFPKAERLAVESMVSLRPLENVLPAINTDKTCMSLQLFASQTASLTCSPKWWLTSLAISVHVLGRRLCWPQTGTMRKRPLYRNPFQPNPKHCTQWSKKTTITFTIQLIESMPQTHNKQRHRERRQWKKVAKHAMFPVGNCGHC